MSDKQPSGIDIIDASTRIGGPSAAELRQPYLKSVGEIAAEHRRAHLEAVEKLKNGGK